MALFPTLAQVRAAQNRPLSNAGVQDTLRGSLFNLGNTGGNQLRGLFGGDSRSDAEREVAKVQAGLLGLDFNNLGGTAAPVANALQAQGNTPQAMAIAGLIPGQGTPAKPSLSFQTLWNEETGKNERVLFVDGQRHGVVGTVKPESGPQGTLRNFHNPETGELDTWQVKDGVKIRKVGTAKPAPEEDPNIDWQFKGEKVTPEGETVSVRFNPADDTAKGFQILVDTGNGPEWVQAPANMTRPVTETRDVTEKADEGSAVGEARALALVTADDVIGGSPLFGGLNISEKKKLAARINDHARLLRRNNRRLGMADARDEALAIAKRDWVKDGSVFGMPFGSDLKTPAEIQETLQDSTEGFTIVPRN